MSNPWINLRIWSTYRLSKEYTQVSIRMHYANKTFTDAQMVGLILSRVWVTIDGFWIGRLDLLHLIYSHSSGLHPYSYSIHFKFTVTQALRFSVFTSRILAMDFTRVCHFKSHMKSSIHSLITSLPLFCSCQFQAHIPAGWRPETPLFISHYCSILPDTNQAEITASIVSEACLLFRCLAINVVLLRPLAPAGMCLPSRCLTMGIHVTIL
jgi:hypothetical protein